MKQKLLLGIYFVIGFFIFFPWTIAGLNWAFGLYFDFPKWMLKAYVWAWIMLSAFLYYAVLTYPV